MELILDSTSWFIILLSLIFPPLLLQSRWKKNQLPPGPKGWPIVGNIFDISMLPHRSLYDLKHKYGPVVWLDLGSTKTMAILTANAAMEVYKKHDSCIIDPSIVHTLETYDYHKSSLAFSPYNGYWRGLRRLCTTELFIAKQMYNTKFIRDKCVNNILSWIEQEVGTHIELTKFVFPSLFNMLGNLMVSRDLVDPYSNMASEFYTAMGEVTECMGRPNISDVFTWLKWLDLQGLRRKMDKHFGTALTIVSKFVEERIDERHGGGGNKNDFLDYLLDFEGEVEKDEPAKLSKKDISLFVLELFIAGTETINTTVEWVISELLCNPETMLKTKDELDRVVGRNKKLEEDHISNLRYLQAVVKETMRLHPPAPLLGSKKATQNIKFMGYNIPKGTQVLINAWAIGRDAEYWGDVLTFKPERFLESDIKYNGQHFGLLPFGAGRRACVGLPLAHQMVHLIVGSLVHEFNWELEAQFPTKPLDMEESTGITARRLNPLKVIPRRHGFKVLSD